jgi:hypothetical protein
VSIASIVANEFFSLFWFRALLCGPGYPQTHDAPASASWCWDYRHEPPCLILMNCFLFIKNHSEFLFPHAYIQMQFHLQIEDAVYCYYLKKKCNGDIVIVELHLNYLHASLHSLNILCLRAVLQTKYHAGLLMQILFWHRWLVLFVTCITS